MSLCPLSPILSSSYPPPSLSLRNAFMISECTSQPSSVSNKASCFQPRPALIAQLRIRQSMHGTYDWFIIKRDVTSGIPFWPSQCTAVNGERAFRSPYPFLDTVCSIWMTTVRYYNSKRSPFQKTDTSSSLERGEMREFLLAIMNADQGESELQQVRLTPADIPGADLSQPFAAHAVPALRWWFLCRGIRAPNSWKKAQLIER